MKISGGFVTNTIENKLPNAFYSYVYKTCSCGPVRYFGTLFWDDITIFWDEHLLLLRFGPIRSLFNYHHNKLSSQNIVISSKHNVRKYHPDDMRRFITLTNKTCLLIKLGLYTLYNVILRIARNFLETRENIKISTHPFYHINLD